MRYYAAPIVFDLLVLAQTRRNVFATRQTNCVDCWSARTLSNAKSLALNVQRGATRAKPTRHGIRHVAEICGRLVRRESTWPITRSLRYAVTSLFLFLPPPPLSLSFSLPQIRRPQFDRWTDPATCIRKPHAWFCLNVRDFGTKNPLYLDKEILRKWNLYDIWFSFKIYISLFNMVFIKNLSTRLATTFVWIFA